MDDSKYKNSFFVKAVKYTLHFSQAVCLCLCLPASACAQAVKTSQATATPTDQASSTSQLPKSTPDPSKYALIISGVSGEEEYAKKFATWSTDLRNALINKLGFAAENVTLLTESNEQSKATAAEVRKVFTTLRSNCKPDHTVFIFMIGHGTSDGKEAKFNLVGPDITATEYAALTKALPAKRVVVVNMASASGDFIKPLSMPGHITITATRSGQETNATHFAEYFIAALTAKDSDADQNQRISVLEAFDYAKAQLERFYKEQNRLVTEHALIDDNGDGKGSEKTDQGDGGLAKITYFDSLLYQLAGGDVELQKYYGDRIRLETEVEQLKARKSQMKPEDYENELEKLLLQLAELNEKIKGKQK